MSLSAHQTGALKNMLEKDIKNQMMEWFGYQKGAFVWVQNQGSYYEGEGKSRHGFKATSIGGVSDILGIWQGYPLAVEVKRPKMKPTDLQIQFLTQFAAAGGIAIVAHSLDELQVALTKAEREMGGASGVFIRNL